MSATTIKASVLHGAKDLRVEDRELPSLAPDEVEVAVQATGLCGSDLHYYNHYRNGDILVREPLSLGHESAGTVLAVGSEVKGLSAGDRVALEVGLPCESCEYCTRGRYNICKEMKFRSSGKYFPHAQGTLQERINHPARWCHKLPSSISLDLGALMEPMGVAMHARNRAALAPASTVLVFGAGAVGLLTAAVAKASKTKSVVICDIQKDRVDFAVDNGFADAGFVVPMLRPETTEEKLAFAKEVAALASAVAVGNDMLGDVDVTFECTGVESCVQSAIYATKPAGKVMLVGMGNPILTLQMSAAALREVDILGVFRYANTYPDAIKMLSDPDSGLPDLRKLITHRYRGMDKITDAFARAAQVKDEEGNLVLKVLVEIGS
ncbi:alcohol dehydrogenase groES-like domain-containing protein [Sarocladium implicatum]|nr:alcohol dehydrogenase groES-like domain-containing protein [Sarocladium implicatum]